MEDWNKCGDASWRKFERIFDIQQNLKTPSTKNGALQTPQAPKKANKHRICRGNLKPRKLTFEPENIESTEEKSKKVLEDSGIALWATSSSALRMEDVDKENRPESEDVVSNTQLDKIQPGSLRSRLNKWMTNMKNAFKLK